MVIFMTKMTYVDALTMVLAMEDVKANDALTDKLKALQNSLAKKGSSKDKKPTAKQKENEGIKARILALMEAEPTRLFTVTELCKAFEEADISNQKMSALLRQLIAEGKVDRVEEKRKAFFSLARD